MAQITFDFDDLALIKDANGFEAGKLSGSAVIDFGCDGQWNIEDISLTGSRLATDEEIKRSGTFVRKQVYLTPDDHGFLFFTVRDQIQEACKDAIDDLVAQAIDIMNEPAGSVNLRQYA